MYSSKVFNIYLTIILFIKNSSTVFILNLNQIIKIVNLLSIKLEDLRYQYVDYIKIF